MISCLPALADVPLNIVPAPKSVQLTGRAIALPEEIACFAAENALRPLVPILDTEYRLLTGGRVVAADTAQSARLTLEIDPALAGQEYTLQIDDTVRVRGGSYQAVAMATTSLLQALDAGDMGVRVPAGFISDKPDSPFRALLVDPARNYHDIATLEQVITLCRWYRINYLQLHLTDDNAFTFTTEAFPALATEGHRYTKQQLTDLVEFAGRRGLTIIPELEVPGHAGQLVAVLPEDFGHTEARRNPHTINMGREAAYRAIDQIVGELAEVFHTTPYIHMGGDEARLEHLENDPDIKQYMAGNELADVQELFRHFLIRMNGIVRKHGRQMIIWEGFRRGGDVQVPRDVIVVAWETLYHLPQHLLEDGYTVINASWKPLYVTKNRNWAPEDIFRWNLYRWENWLEAAPSYRPIQLEKSPHVIGAMMCSWAQLPQDELPTLRRRLPAMCERVWNATREPQRPADDFFKRLRHTDACLEKLLPPPPANETKSAQRQ